MDSSFPNLQNTLYHPLSFFWLLRSCPCIYFYLYSSCPFFVFVIIRKICCFRCINHIVHQVCDIFLRWRHAFIVIPLITTSKVSLYHIVSISNLDKCSLLYGEAANWSKTDSIVNIATVIYSLLCIDWYPLDLQRLIGHWMSSFL